MSPDILHNKHISIWVHTVSDNYAVRVMIGGETYTLGLCDTAGQKDYDYHHGVMQIDVFLVCFSGVSPLCFENVNEK